MSFSQLPWENRVFRIDRECYLLFLGIDELDQKPFVRIGNSSWLDERVLEVISHTVITESFTGNPFGEVGLTHHYNGLYLGEPKIVEVIKSFFGRFHVTDSEVISYSEQEEREGRDHVYFYNTGNIVVTFGGQRLFDLYAREKADRHYNYYCSEILGIFRKNPLKWEPGSIRGKGFFRAGENLFFFDGGKLLGLRWDRNYFKTLARAGWDPDKLESILVNLKPEEMEGDKSAGVMNFIKRGIAARNPMTFFSRDKDFSGKIEPLFEYVRSRDVPIHFNDISDKGNFEWNGTAGEWNNETFTFNLTDSVDVKINEQGRASLHFEDYSCDCNLADSVPSRILPETPALSRLMNTYIDGVAKAVMYSDIKGDELRFVREAYQVVQAFYEGWENGRGELTVPQQKNVAEMKRLVRTVGKGDDERLTLFASNCAVLLRLISGEESPLAAQAGEASSLLSKQIKEPVQQASDFLFSADYYKEGCFYLPYKLDISPGDRDKAQDMHDALAHCDKQEVDFFFSERKRLEAILAALSEGTLWEDMKKHEERQATLVESAPPAAPKKEAASHTSDTSRNSDIPQVKTGGKTNSKKSPSRLWLLLLLLLLIPLGWLGFDYFTSGEDSFLGSTIASFQSTSSPGSSSSSGDGDSLGQEVSNTGGDPSHAESLEGGSREAKDNSPGNKTVLTGEEEVPDTSPLSDNDSMIIPGEKEGEEGEVVFQDTEETIVTKPFVMDDTFLEHFSVGGILITMADIHLKANAISVMNGYRDLGFHLVDGADPTIIEPGLVLKIPGNLTYKVKEADNIWYIAARLLESELAEHTRRFEELKNQYGKNTEQGLGQKNILEEMDRLLESSNCENFRIEVQNWLNKR